MKEKIPKIIHYCWFGKGPKPELVLKCIASWEKYLPDYEIKEWNENNFDINSNIYCKEAYERKKYAFVSDYVRLYAVYNEGGIYFDTDLEVIKNMDVFLNNKAFTGFEDNEFAFTAVFGALKHSKWLKKLLDYYDNKHFVDEMGNMNLTPNTQIVTEINVNYFHLKNNNTYQNLGEFVIYPSEYFSPKSWKTNEINITDNTYTIHHFSASWHDKYEKKLINKKRYFIKKYGEIEGAKKYKKYYNRHKYFIKFQRFLDNPKIILKKLKRRK